MKTIQIDIRAYYHNQGYVECMEDTLKLIPYLSQKIFNDLNEKGAELGNVSLHIIQKSIEEYLK